MLKKILVLVTLIAGYICWAAPVQAQEYQVKSYIVVPSNFDTPEVNQNLPKYKNDILQALKDVQAWYKDKLSGHTFKFSSEIEVVKTNIPAIHTNSTLQMHDELNGDKLIPWERGLVKTIWMIGSKDIAEWGGHGDDDGRAWLSLPLLEGIAYPDPTSRNFPLGVLAHELGHAFGLVFSGYARGHPCTVNYPNECIDIAPKPYPDKDEEKGSVMSYGGTFYYPNTGFNNSIYNPEQWKLYQVAFLNPNHDPAPERKPSSRSASRLLLYTYTYKPGDIVTILTRDSKDDFGLSGKVEVATYGSSPRALTDIIEWNNQKIRVRLPSDFLPEGLSSPAQLFVTTLQASFSSNIFIQGRQKRLTAFSANFKLTCRKDGQDLPIPFVKVSLFLDRTPLPNERVGSSVTDRDGTSAVTLTNPEVGPYLLVPERINYVKFNILLKTFTIPKGEDINDVNIAFNYPECPPDLVSLVNNQDVGNTAPTHLDKKNQALEEQESEGVNPKSTPSPKLEKVVITNNEDQERTENPPNEGGSQPVVIDNPDQPQQLDWSPSTSNGSQPVHINQLYSDGTVKQYQTKLQDTQTTQVGNITLKAKVVKKITKVEIAGKEVNLSDPQNVIAQSSLPESPDNDGRYRVPMLVCFNNAEDDCIRTAYVFTLSTPGTVVSVAPTPLPNPCPDEEFCNQEQGIIIEKGGGVKDETTQECRYNFIPTDRSCQ